MPKSSVKLSVLLLMLNACVSSAPQLSSPSSSPTSLVSSSPVLVSPTPSAMGSTSPAKPTASPTTGFVHNEHGVPVDLSSSAQPVQVSPIVDEKPLQIQDIQVDLWPWGAKAAVSFTCDEGMAEPYEILLPEVEKRGWRMTFYIYTQEPALPDTWPLIKAAHERGNEIATHTHTHTNMTKQTVAELHHELEGPIQILRQNVAKDLPFQSFAYPYEATNEPTWQIVKDYHRYARSGDHGAAVPPNPVPINDARNPNFGALTAKANTREYSVEKWNSWIDATVASGGWFIEEWHGVSDGQRSAGWEPRTIDEFKAHLDHIETYHNQLWVSPVRNVGNYIEKRERASIELRQSNETSISAVIKDIKTEPGFIVPLTFTIQLPDAWVGKQIKAEVQGESVDLHPVFGDSSKVRVLIPLDQQAELKLHL